ncbi:MAG: peptide chain release factor 2 [Ruminococcus sp.]|nr:peptide chain release factor 2 [Ruminococcus sp.]
MDQLEIEYKNYAKKLEDPQVWSNIELSAKLAKEQRQISHKLDTFFQAQQDINNVTLLVQLAEEYNDESCVSEIETELSRIEQELEELKLQTLLGGKHDGANAIISLHAGAGGTEACDWAEMLYRMYLCYSEKHGFRITELNRVAGDGAGIKSITFKIEGDNAYGFLKAEHGVHRLVRISPFDANARRQTSFTSVEVLPEIDTDTAIVIRPEDLEVDTFRASGAGGQHVNKTESAIRITHKPTGIIVACQNERSQIQNREQAMKMLASKLAALQEEQQQNELSALKNINKSIVSLSEQFI